MARLNAARAIKRYPVANGIFYPDSPETLAGQLCSWGLREGQSGLACGGQVLIAPHGTWTLTGNAAGTAFTEVQARGKKNGRPVSLVILLGSASLSGEEGIYLSESAFFETPLGQIPVDLNMNRKLSSCSTLIEINDIPHLIDHSLEVFLPLVRYCFPEAKIVPILISGKKPVLISALARAINVVFEEYMEESLFIVSSNAAQDPDPSLASAMAGEFCTLLEKMDDKAFLTRLNEGRISASGSVPVCALLESRLFEGRNFSLLCPLSHCQGELGETVYYGAFLSGKSEEMSGSVF